ncbi:MAG TPA: phytase [Oleiagrimonas sp.]|nr:phytase [Oleiagrimonas sp.]
MRFALVLGLAALSTVMAGCSRTPPDARQAPVVTATVETPPVASDGDAADDPAIWVSPRDPAQSLIVGTDKGRGLELYTLAGKRLQALKAGDMNNVDLRAGFAMNRGDIVLVAASDRTHQALAFFRLDTQQRRLQLINRITVDFDEPYGLCMSRNAAGEFFVFMGDKNGHLDQWQLSAAGGKVQARHVRSLRFDSQTEGCTVDAASGTLYVGEEGKGIWRLSAAADADGSDRTLIDHTGTDGHLVADVEGVDLYRGADAGGYLVVSSQGDNRYTVYTRAVPNRYLGSFRIGDRRGGPDGVSDTDGLAVAAGLRTDAYPAGLLVVQDGHNTDPEATQDFKYVSWADVAAALKLSR